MKSAKNKPKRPIAKPLFGKPVSAPTGKSPAKAGITATSDLNKTLSELHAKFQQLYFSARYAEALAVALQTIPLIPNNADLLSSTSACYIHLGDFAKAIEYGLRAITADPNNINAYDALSHGYGELNDGNDHFLEVQKYGKHALELRDRQYGQNPPLAYQPIDLPPPPSPATKAHNIISFSLFGALPKYCETAVLNAQVAKDVYPNWTCRFYVDDSVPSHIKQRFIQAHAQVIEISQLAKGWRNAYPDFDGDLTHIPPTLWRFLALDDDSVHRAIFRDADSLIWEQEALAVEEWVASGKYFHMMRDSHSHTELILAGMWGAVAGVLTQQQTFAEQIIRYMQDFGDKNRHFADQFFLRDTQWATVKTSLIQHDSYFVFLNAKPFPQVPQAVMDKHIATYDKHIRIGSNISGGYFQTLVNENDGEMVVWQMQDDKGNLIGEYQDPAKDGKITVFFPRMLLNKINDNTLKIVLKPKAEPIAMTAPKNEAKPSQVETKAVEALLASFQYAFGVEQDYTKALDFLLKAYELTPNDGTIVSNIATCYLYLENYPKAIEFGLKAMAFEPKTINAYDVLSHAYGNQQDLENAKKYGLIALQRRDELYGQAPSVLPKPIPLPPPPSPATKANNIISFSLFGASAKYCETAVLNAQVAKRLYPNWTCRFYVDDSVPSHVIERLQQADSQIVTMTGSAMPATMWRFLALDDKALHRVIFRDADSLISEAEAHAVTAWIASGQYFHVMRDNPAHTELVLAGMWGAVAGVLTQSQSFERQITDYLASLPKHNARFIDQFFLRETQWRVIKHFMYQHDSQFGFLGAGDFPTAEREVGSHIGSNVANHPVSMDLNFPDGCSVTWGLQRPDGSLMCQYEAVIQDKKIQVYLPKQLFKLINENELKLKLF